MSNTLILMRHGKAVNGSEGQPDINRRLSDAGKRSLTATLPLALGLMERRVSVQVWTSPALRAQQTAEVMHDALSRHGCTMQGGLHSVDALWRQDAESFLGDVRACEADVVVAVGHNPFIEEVTARLTGSTIDYATGGFAAIRLDAQPSTEESDSERAGSRLLWFAQGPVSQRWKTLVQMERTLSKAAHAVLERREAFVADPDDIETMHKLRVSIRTLRSLLAFTAPWQDATQNKQAQSDLRDVVAETSRLRELDVLGEQASAMQGASPELAAYCASLAAEERARVLRTMNSKKTVRKLERIADELDSVKWRKRFSAEGLEASDVRERFDKLADELAADLEALDIADVEATHDVRKSAKRVRYDAEQFKDILGDDAPDVARAMTSHQDNLGAICDARVNIDIINGLSAESLPSPVAWDLALLRAQNETFLYTTLRASDSPRT